MKKLIIFLLIFLLYTDLNGQTDFEQGYIIDLQGQRIPCLIHTIFKKNNPTSIEYKRSENSAITRAGLEEVQEFGIGSYTKFVRVEVNIDRSNTDLNFLLDERNPTYQRDTLFLKVLVEGKANLYSYEKDNLIRFFYELNNGGIQQLVYKLYKRKDGELGKNMQFRQQLLNHVNCDQQGKTSNLAYKRKPLTNYFIQYNECTNSTPLVYKEPKKAQFLLSLKGGVNYNSMTTRSSFTNVLNYDFGPKLGYTFGASAEVLLPFNQQRWSILFEPSYQYFNDVVLEEGSFQTIWETDTHYKAIDLSTGVQYYINLTTENKLFLNSGLVLAFPLQSEIDFARGLAVDRNKPTWNVFVGLGGVVKKYFSLEFRYNTPRNIIKDLFFDTSYSGFALVFGYQFNRMKK